VTTKDQSACVDSNTWAHWGLDIYNRRWNTLETKISTATAPTLTKGWYFNISGDISATPTIVNGRMYVPDWSGNLYCLDALTGAVIWTKTIVNYVAAVEPSAIIGVTNTSIISRTSPAISGTTMIVGVMKKLGGFPFLLAINTADGSLIWGKRVHSHVAAMVTQSPTIYQGYIYQGISSLEELLADAPGYDCCTFIGEVQKLSLTDGTLVWKTLMSPDNGNAVGGFSGNSVWGSSPAIDPVRGLVYIATGNNYAIPQAMADCLLALEPLGPGNVDAQVGCERLENGILNFHNSVVALRVADGTVAWSKQLGGPDAWNAACIYKDNPSACPNITAPDYDFAQAPMLVTACRTGVCRQQVMAGQKSGIMWALNPDSGEVYWWKQAGPGGTVGGLQWGSAADDTRIYVANNNYLQLTLNVSSPDWHVANPAVSTAANGGLAMALDSWNGSIVWTFINPNPHWSNASNYALSQAPMTVANGVVYYASMDPAGVLYYLNAATGAVLGSFSTGATLGCGPSVVDGRVYTGSGYTNFGLGKKGIGMYALQLPGAGAVVNVADGAGAEQLPIPLPEVVSVISAGSVDDAASVLVSAADGATVPDAVPLVAADGAAVPAAAAAAAAPVTDALPNADTASPDARPAAALTAAGAGDGGNDVAAEDVPQGRKLLSYIF